MASIKIDGVAMVLQENDKQLLGMDKLVRQMLKRGAEILVKSQQAHIETAINSYTPKYKVRRTGALAESIEAGSIKKTDESARIDVYPHGDRTDKWHKTPTRNATIGFVVNYGKKNTKSRPFIKQTVEDCEPAIKRTWEEMLHEYLANGRS